MGRADYHGATKEIQRILKDEAGFEGVTVTAEHSAVFGFEALPWVNVRLGGRRDLGREPAAAGTISWFAVQWICECRVWMGSAEESAKERDRIMGMVELALMKDRTLTGLVKNGFIAGGNTQVETYERGDTALMGEVIFQAEITAQTT